MSVVSTKQAFTDKINYSDWFKFKSINRLSSRSALFSIFFMSLMLIGCGGEDYNSSGVGGYSGNSSNTSTGGESDNSSNIDNRSIFAGFIDSFIVSNGKAYGAGYNNLGQLGLGDTEHRHVFTEIASLSDKNITAFDVGFYHVLALSDEGKVYGAGRNENSELGLTDTNDRTVFTAVSSLKNRTITAIAAGQAYSLALSNEGKVYAAGKSTDGSLGLGYTERSTAFTEVPSLGGKNITAITTGNFHSLALSDEGKVYAAGRNSDGQLGLGDTSVGRNVFMEVSSLSGIVAIAAGSHYSLALSSDGKVYAAGRNKEGQLGLGDTNSSNTFTEVTSLSDKNVTAIAAGQSQTLILTDEGKVYVVGGNEYGQLGLGDTISRQAFTEVPNLSNITAIAAGEVHSLALCDDGKVYGAGRNANGQLSLGDTNNRHSFTEVTVP